MPKYSFYLFFLFWRALNTPRMCVMSTHTLALYGTPSPRVYYRAKPDAKIVLLPCAANVSQAFW